MSKDAERISHFDSGNKQETQIDEGSFYEQFTVIILCQSHGTPFLILKNDVCLSINRCCKEIIYM